MTYAERAVALYELCLKLDELITTVEMETFPFLDLKIRLSIPSDRLN